MSDQVSFAPPVADGRGQWMRAPDEVAAMLRLRALGWGTRRIAAELGCNRETVRRYLAAGGWAPYRTPERPGRWPGMGRGWPSGFAAIAAMPTWCARSLRPSWGSSSACARSSGRWRTCGASSRRRRWRRCASRRRRGGSCRSTSASAGCAIGDERCGSTCSWRRSATRAGSMPAPSGTSGSRLGSTGWRARSGTSAACRRRCCSTMPRRWSSTTTRPPGRWCSTPACTPSRATGACGRVACAPYRARTKGKDERGVGYVKRNAIAGRSFASWAALEAHLAWWMREVADQRVHGTTGEVPIGAVRARGAPGAAPARRQAAVPADARADPLRAERRLRGRRHQPLQRALAADRRAGQRRWSTTARCGSAMRARRWRATGSGGVGASAPWIVPTCAASWWAPGASRRSDGVVEAVRRLAPISCGRWPSTSRSAGGAW